MEILLRFVLFSSLCLSSFCLDSNNFEDDLLIHGGWNVMHDPHLYSSICTIDRVGVISAEEFDNVYLQKKPVIIQSGQDNSLFLQHTEKEYLLNRYGHISMMLSSANTFSYKRDYITLEEYINDNMEPRNLNTSGDATFYLFGGNHNVLVTDLFPDYKRPPYADSNEVGSISFGIASSGSGVPLHRHGHVFAEVLYGMKRWFLYLPDEKPDFDPDASTLQWYYNVYPTLKEEDKPIECTLKPGEILYIPDWWWHATLNLGETVFISTFV